VIGELVAGRYEIQKLLGSGGMSSVFLARDRQLERPVALKVLHEHFSHDPEYIERFRREARAIAKLSHPNVVTIIDRGEFEGRQYIVFEYVEGDNLKQLVAGGGPLPVEQALALAHQVARGLAFAHEHGIVHRDVKPHNVLVDQEGVAKVTDFGIARSLELEEGITETGTLLGTSDYISPEQAGGQRVDERTDQYSLGVLLYELLTGEVPFKGKSSMAVAMRHLRDPVPSVRERRPDVSPRVDDLVRRAMAKDPGKRFPSTEALVEALEACRLEEVSGETGATQQLAQPARPARSAPARPRRRPRSLPLAPLAVLLVLAAGALAIWVVAGDGGDDGAAGGAAVRLVAVSDYDPQGDDSEHPSEVPLATDGDRSTYWTTETYSSFMKGGVGIVLDARRRVDLELIVLLTDEPGFAAEMLAGDRRIGPFHPVSEERRAARRTTFELSGPEEYRYYVVWITEPNGRAHVNEVRAR
jgi:eukaryotic-like serine/threonine-protein kinase